MSNSKFGQHNGVNRRCTQISTRDDVFRVCGCDVFRQWSALAIRRAAGQEVVEPCKIGRHAFGRRGDFVPAGRAMRRCIGPRSLSKCAADPTPIKGATALRCNTRRHFACPDTAAVAVAFPSARERFDRVDRPPDIRAKFHSRGKREFVCRRARINWLKRKKARCEGTRLFSTRFSRFARCFREREMRE